MRDLAGRRQSDVVRRSRNAFTQCTRARVRVYAQAGRCGRGAIFVLRKTPPDPNSNVSPQRKGRRGCCPSDVIAKISIGITGFHVRSNAKCDSRDIQRNLLGYLSDRSTLHERTELCPKFSDAINPFDIIASAPRIDLVRLCLHLFRIFNKKN